MGRATGRIASTVCLAALCWPHQLGGPFDFTVVAGRSMEPSMHVGDLVVGTSGPVHEGDVVVFRPPEIDSSVIHRVHSVTSEGVITTQGDNNAFLDPWKLREQDVHAVERVTIPAVGSLLGSRLVWTSVLITGAGLCLMGRRRAAAHA